jgi:hypothetical protein
MFKVASKNICTSTVSTPSTFSAIKTPDTEEDPDNTEPADEDDIHEILL